jgi:phosphopantothenoylcysteine decarboxylase
VTGAAAGPVLYAVACGSPAAGHIGQLVRLAQQAGWRVCVVATPDGRHFLDAPALTAQTGYPVRSEYKRPGDVDVLPVADAIVVAPATVNTVNKWACGIADTLALGVLIEGYGLGVPIVVMPYTNTAMAAHPAFRQSLRRLRGWGVRVLFGDDVLALPEPGAAAGQAGNFPWHLALSAVGPPPTSPTRSMQQSAQKHHKGRLTWASRPLRIEPGARRRLAPPSNPRTAPAILRVLP